MARQITKDTINLIKYFENFSSEPYKDGTGFAIGYGNHYYEDKRPVGAHDTPIDEARGEKILTAALNHYISVVETATQNTTLTDNEFGALVSFAYNVGDGQFKNSTLLQTIRANAKDYSEIEKQFGRWIKSGPQIVDGLIKRRASEFYYYSKGQLNFDASIDTSYNTNTTSTEYDAISDNSKRQVRFQNTNYCSMIICNNDVRSSDLDVNYDLLDVSKNTDSEVQTKAENGKNNGGLTIADKIANFIEIFDTNNYLIRHWTKTSYDSYEAQGPIIYYRDKIDVKFGCVQVEIKQQQFIYDITINIYDENTFKSVNNLNSIPDAYLDKLTKLNDIVNKTKHKSIDNSTFITSIEKILNKNTVYNTYMERDSGGPSFFNVVLGPSRVQAVREKVFQKIAYASGNDGDTASILSTADIHRYMELNEKIKLRIENIGDKCAKYGIENKIGKDNIVCFRKDDTLFLYEYNTSDKSIYLYKRLKYTK